MNRIAPARTNHRTGGTYIAVMVATLVVTLIGLSAVLAARIERRAAAADEDAVRARFYARSFAEIILQRLNNDATWRATSTNAAWSANETFDGATVAFRLTDEADANLANDATDAFRIQTRATCGTATRSISMAVQPPTFGSGGAAPDKIENGSMERITVTTAPPVRWYQYPSGPSDSVSDYVHGGTYAARAYTRTTTTSGMSQNLAISQVKKGTTYDVVAWVRYGGAVQAKAGLVVTDSTGATTKFQVSAVTGTNAWKQITGTITPTWNGSLTSARFHVETATGLLDLRVDDCSLKEHAGTSALNLLAGTVKRELAN